MSTGDFRQKRRRRRAAKRGEYLSGDYFTDPADKPSLSKDESLDHSDGDSTVNSKNEQFQFDYFYNIVTDIKY